ncbi:DHBP synthase RibB-like alpha/beta domain-containing protein [Xylaria bambusicola]|uniref:DHBP synthase RibB-like alpha/beta domain-containing protein n=1 Tax=Xylaria bambusicola TaxID=326684 RepID=UPI00200867DB|nr:DHBP synthase RibB-like alpha/beta domain-containing protein [Xylaria bambusicola]KAI0527761.1 DHBP synthase RibB-like alpha/beta domain-containing protein [Xylaria bambusicola]
MASKTPRVIPAPGKVPDVQRDAREAFEVLKAGGVIIAPIDTGYGLMACSAEGIERAFAAKQRKFGHTVGVIGTYETHEQLHILPPEKFEITRVITQGMSSMLGVIAHYRKDHPRLAAWTPETLALTTRGDTLGIGIAECPFLRELGRLNDEDGQLMVGSSANLTGRGAKFLIEDIEPEVFQSADLVVDYGLQRYHRYQRSGTIIDMENMRVLRMGANYEVFRERIRKWWGVELPEDPENKIDRVNGVGVGVSINVK